MISSRTPRLVLAAAAGLVAVIAPSAIASAHTETDFVAVPAGSTATVTFEPEHGCGDSPTIDMRVQSPVAGATAVERDGWTATSSPQADGTTVLQWSGGSQPADEEGAFQVRFQVPDAVGTLLVFPAVQQCENGEQEAWIETGPDAESPAPQLLVLPAGTQPAVTLDDVSADAPGRDLLVAALSGGADDDAADGGAAPATSEPATTAAATTTSAAAPTTTAASSTTAAATTTTAAATTTTAPPTTSTSAAPTTTTASGGDSSSTGWIIAVVIAAVVVIGAVGAVVLRRRSSSAG